MNPHDPYTIREQVYPLLTRAVNSLLSHEEVALLHNFLLFLEWGRQDIVSHMPQRTPFENGDHEAEGREAHSLLSEHIPRLKSRGLIPPEFDERDLARELMQYTFTCALQHQIIDSPWRNLLLEFFNGVPLAEAM